MKGGMRVKYMLREKKHENTGVKSFSDDVQLRNGIEGGGLRMVKYTLPSQLSVQTALVFIQTSVFNCHLASQRRHLGVDESLTYEMSSAC